MSKNNKIKLIAEQYSFFAAIFSLLIFILLLFYKINLHSDILYLDELFTDLLQNNGKWADWKFSPAPSYAPDMLLYYIAYNILPTAALRIYFVTICQVFIIISLIFWLIKKIRPQISFSIKTLILLIFVYICIIAFYSTASIGIFFNSNNIQVPTLIFSLLLIGLFIDFFENHKLLNAFLIIVIAAIAKASSAVFVLCFLIPAFVALLSALIFFQTQRGKLKYRKIILKSLGILLSAHFAGEVLEKFLTINDPLKERLQYTKEAAYRSLKMFDDSLKFIRSTDNLYTCIFSYFCFFIFIFLTIYLIKYLISVIIKINKNNFNNIISEHLNENWKLKILIIFAFFSIPVTWAGSILSGGYIDLFCLRYFMLAITLSLLIAFFKLDEFIENNKINIAYYILPLAVIIILLAANALIFVKNEFKEKSLNYIAKYGAVERKELKIANCLINIEKSGVKLKSGIADFWYARGVRQYLPNKNYIIAVLNDINPFFWISTIGPIARSEIYPDIFYNFVILHQAYEVGQFDFTPKTIGSILPTQYTRHACDEANAEIWVYNGNELDAKVKSVFDKFLIANGFKNISEFTADILNSATGKLQGNYRVAEQGADKAGYLTFGPYFALSEGEYEVKFNYSAKLTGKKQVGYFEIGNFSSPQQKLSLAKKNINSEKNNLIKTKITVPSGGIKNLEIRTWFNGSGKLLVKSVKFEKI